MAGRGGPPAPRDLRAGTGVFADGGAAAATGSLPPPQGPPDVDIVLAGGVGAGGVPPARPPAAPVPPPPPPSLSSLVAAHPHAILVARRQEGNPLLPFIRSCRWAYADVVADYHMGLDCAAAFLSLRYHLLHPDYIARRATALATRGGPRVKILLVHVDADDPAPPLEGLNALALRAGLTLVCAFSAAEAARYLELLHAFAGAGTRADAIAGRVGDDAASRLAAALTSVRGVNKADVLTLWNAFGTPAGVFKATPAALAAAAGVGPTKAARLAAALRRPFFGGAAPARQARLDDVMGGARAARAARGGGASGGSAPAAAPAPLPEPDEPPPASEADNVIAWASLAAPGAVDAEGGVGEIDDPDGDD